MAKTRRASRWVDIRAGPSGRLQRNGGLTLTNPTWSAGVFSFDVLSQATTNLTVEYSSTLRSNQWQTLLTTNSPVGHCSHLRSAIAHECSAFLSRAKLLLEGIACGAPKPGKGRRIGIVFEFRVSAFSPFPYSGAHEKALAHSAVARQCRFASPGRTRRSTSTTSWTPPTSGRRRTWTTTRCACLQRRGPGEGEAVLQRHAEAASRGIRH